MPEPALPSPVPPRDAASLLVLRGDGPELLMGLRGAGHRFMPNRLVFPGGAVDPADYTAPVAARLALPAQALLEHGATPELAQALAVAAARELEEETGLSLGSPPDLSGLDYFFRAITPPDSPVRFDARFFTVSAHAVTGTLSGSGELEDLRWYGVEEALALDLARPTRAVIGQFRAWLALTPAGRAARPQVPMLEPRTLDRD